MIPTIGLMIAAYIGMRCLDAIMRADEIKGGIARGLVVAAAVIALLVAVGSAVDLTLSGASLSPQ